jgi:hypothetical protein
MELVEFLKAAQGVGAPVALVAVYFLWKIDKSLSVMKNANEVLTETLLRLVPGFRNAHEESKRENAIKESSKQ